MSEGEFKVIKSKRRSTRNLKNLEKSSNFSCVSLPIKESQPPEVIIRRVNSAKEEIVSSAFYQSLIQNLTEGNNEIGLDVDIVCYGIGQFSESVSSRYQFAFLLALKELCKSRVSVYDPVLSSDEIDVIGRLDCFTIELNEEGKREVTGNTIFFLPHCPKQLVNNLLWKNWNNKLSKCIIVGNSFKKICESHSDRFLKENLLYLFHASSVVTEISVNNNFKFTDIFNDLSIHFFYKKNIETLSDSVLNLNKEPVYQKDDIEFVTHFLQNSFKIN